MVVAPHPPPSFPHHYDVGIPTCRSETRPCADGTRGSAHQLPSWLIYKGRSSVYRYSELEVGDLFSSALIKDSDREERVPFYVTHTSLREETTDLLGAMGFLDYVAEVCYVPRSDRRKLKKRKQLQTVEIKVKMDCEGCERRVRKSVESMRGVTKVQVERTQSKLTVTGYVDPGKVLRRVRHRTGKVCNFWPYVQYDLVDHPYVQGAYDKKAPRGYVRNVLLDPQASSLALASSPEIKYTTAFSDDNPHACVVM